jgi:hypothetical protein
MKKNLLILTLIGLFSIPSFAENVQVKSLNQGACWLKEGNSGVKIVSFNQGISVELNDETLSKIHELDLPTGFEEELEVKAFCSSHGLSLVLNTTENKLRYCIWLNIEKDGFSEQSVGLTDSSGKCDGYRPGELILTIAGPGVERSGFLNKLEKGSTGINFKRYEVLSAGLIKIELNREDHGHEVNFISKFKKFGAVKYAEKSFFYHPIGEWSDLETLGR